MMGQTLNLKLSDDTYTALQKQAEAVGTSPEALVRELLEKRYHLNPYPKEEEQKARLRFENHFGEVGSGYPTGADNKSIDKDLAKAYADTHETS